MWDPLPEPIQGWVPPWLLFPGRFPFQSEPSVLRVEKRGDLVPVIGLMWTPSPGSPTAQPKPAFESHRARRVTGLPPLLSVWRDEGQGRRKWMVVGLKKDGSSPATSVRTNEGANP